LSLSANSGVGYMPNIALNRALPWRIIASTDLSGTPRIDAISAALIDFR
jgi:hypothetical protein